MIDNLVKGVLARIGIDENDIDKAKEILNKIEFTMRDGKKTMVIHIGDGVELSIVQREN